MPLFARAAAPLLLGALIGGCANRPPALYYWGDYQFHVYSQLAGEANPAEEIDALEQIREKARAAGAPLPPGFHAHLALLYGMTGQSDKMAANLEKEKSLFPESTTYMNSLLSRGRAPSGNK